MWSLFRGGFLFLADLPADALGAEFTVGFGITALAAFFAVPLVIFLANGKCGAIGVTNAIHLIQLLFFNHLLFGGNLIAMQDSMRGGSKGFEVAPW